MTSLSVSYFVHSRRSKTSDAASIMFWPGRLNIEYCKAACTKKAKWLGWLTSYLRSSESTRDRSRLGTGGKSERTCAESCCARYGPRLVMLNVSPKPVAGEPGAEGRILLFGRRWQQRVVQADVGPKVRNHTM
jgi:hypothetical protein